MSNKPTETEQPEVAKQHEGAIEEIWDKHSYYIGDSLSDFEMVSGRSILLPGDYKAFATDVLALQPPPAPTRAGEEVTKEALIKTIHLNSANLDHIAKSQHVSGTLYLEIKRVMDTYATSALSTKEAEIARLTKWHPIEDYDKTKLPVVMRWHKIWKCLVAVSYRGDKWTNDCEWIDGTKTNTWPEAAFTPLFQLMPDWDNYQALNPHTDDQK